MEYSIYLSTVADIYTNTHLDTESTLLLDIISTLSDKIFTVCMFMVRVV